MEIVQSPLFKRAYNEELSILKSWPIPNIGKANFLIYNKKTGHYVRIISGAVDGT